MSYDTLIFITNILIVVYGAIICALIYYSHIHEYMAAKSITFLKTVLGAIVLAAAYIYWYLLKNFTVRSDIYFSLQALIILAIFIAFIGEYFSYNIGLDENKFKRSLILKFVSYILLIAVECLIYRVWITEAVIAVVLVIIVQLSVNKNAYLPSIASRKFYLAYTIAISFLLAKAAAVVIKEKSYNTLLFLIGAALLFFAYIFMRLWGGASDKEGFANARLISFYAGLMLIAVSISPEYFDFFAY